MYTLNLDDGYSFGLGIFETIALKNQRPVFPEEHLKRLFHSLDKLHIENPQVRELLTANRLSQEAARCPYPKGVLKISVSERNLLFSCRENTYTEGQYQRGFHVQLSPVLRNETSPLTYHKTLNYGDNI
ncbi:MAG: aminotransferase class IV, partial [Blautia hydrogenotrophica]